MLRSNAHLSDIACKFKLLSLLLTLLLFGCGSSKSKSVSLTDVFPSGDDFPDWTLSGEPRVFDRENIFNLVNGQAELFFVYGFEQVAVQDYAHTDGPVMGVEVWQLATPSDAYGLFTASAAGTPVDIGNDGETNPGRRLIFWQDRYYVHVRARQQLDDADLRRFAEAISEALPSGGERPTLVDRLPGDGLAGRGPLFFHEELSIQNEIWLGDENLLGLSAETDGLLAQYDVGGSVAKLMLIAYPKADEAAAGLAALQGSQIDGLVTAEARDNLLGAVFGEVDGAAAQALLAEALQ